MESAVAEAIKAFEAVLLLDPENCEAKLYLGACLAQGKARISWTIGFQHASASRLEQSRGFYREIIASGKPAVGAEHEEKARKFFLE